MSHRARRTAGLVAVAVCVLSAAAGAADLKAITKELFAVPSTTGNEDLLAAKIRGLLPKDLAVEADGLGTIAVRAGGRGGAHAHPRGPRRLRPYGRRHHP